MNGFLLPLTASRFGAGVATMTYAGSLPFLLSGWGMSGTSAGAVQSAFNAAYAVSLLLCSLLADRVGASRVFSWANWATAVAFVACALFARSPEGALVLFGLLGLTLGGSYAPALMLVAEAVPSERRGAAVGLALAGASCGYFAAIALAAGLVPAFGHGSAWLVLCVPVVLSAAAGSLAVRRHAGARSTEAASGHTPEPISAAALLSRRSALLTGGYVAHCWELLGIWAWAPAFLTLSLLSDRSWDPVLAGLAAAAALHLSGAAATLVGGGLSDRVGRRPVLVWMALAGAALSLALGQGADLGAATLLVLAAACGFATIGDSGVLTTAMTEAVDPRRLGSVLALRSILGFGAGALSPLAFGWILDATNPGREAPGGWGWAFALLGAGGLVAALCALLLPRDAPHARCRACREA